MNPTVQAVAEALYAVAYRTESMKVHTWGTASDGIKERWYGSAKAAIRAFLKTGEISEIREDLEEIEGLSTDDFATSVFLCRALPDNYKDLWITRTKNIARKAIANLDALEKSL